MNRNAIAALWLIAGEAAALGGEATSRNPNAATSAVILGLGDRKGQLLYRWSVKVFISDTVRWKSAFAQPDGTLAAEDELFLHRGAFRGYRYVRWTSGERSEVWVRGGHVVFRRQLPGEYPREREEPLEDGFVTGPYLGLYLVKHWDAVVRGHTLKIRFGVPDQLRSFAFRVSRDRLREGDRGEVIVARMSPSSALIRWFIEPIYFRFTPDGALLAIEGRTLPVERRRNSMAPVDALFQVEDRAALTEITQRSLRP
jgi:hypothetical protein